MFNSSGTRAVVLCLLCTLLLAGVAQAQVEAFTEVTPGTYDPAKAAAEQKQLSNWLMAAETKSPAEGFTAAPTSEQIAQMKNASADAGRMMVGVMAPLKAAVGLGAMDTTKAMASGWPTAHAGGIAVVKSDGFVWYTTVRSKGATAMRLHLTDVNLPEQVELYVYNQRGEAYGPYNHQDKVYEQYREIWTHTVTGSEIRLQIRYSGKNALRALKSTRFVIDEISHLGDRFQLAKYLNPELADDKAFCSFNESCVQNASCSSIPGAIQPVRNAVAHLQFAVGASVFICTGTLLNDTDPNTANPRLLLTANHCFSTTASANSLQSFFQFSTNCNGACGLGGGVPSVTGSSILATNSSSDYNLVRINSNPPGGSTLMGWTTAAVANSNGTSLFRVSHPRGAPQAYNTQDVDTSAGTCGGIPRGAWIYSRDTFGATEGGSSGSAVLNASGQVVGQLTGACGPNPSVACDNSNATIDGALAAYFSAVDEFLDPQDPGDCHTDVLGGFGFCSSSCTCANGEGDCDNNGECDPGLICGTDNGPQFGFGNLVDVCVPPGDCHTDVLGGFGFCSNSCTCANGEGDCDSDAQCDAGLVCGTDNGPQFGFGNLVDVCVPPSNPNSCAGNCGQQAPGGCWCDSLCAGFGDCCSDKVAECGP